MIVYRIDYKSSSVVPVEAESLSTRDCQRFATELDAWLHLVKELEAGISLGAAYRARARAELERVTASLADEAERLAKAQKGLRRARNGGS
jgi:hypothetical protein